MSPDIRIIKGDITTVRVDAVVNAANSSLLGGGGVDGAIHRAAGQELLAACRQLRQEQFPEGLRVGDAVATPAYRLPASWVIHTVGPNRHAGQTDPELLASCFKRSLEVADECGAETVAFPAISAGIYGWEPTEVARVAMETVTHYDSQVREVTFVLFSDRLTEAFRSAATDSRG